ncbi:MAG: DUF4105 domain-containing protein [Planctomycetes bacterium]|nr:DUF4105 domain-containing protein [Planctomycetota bacterium]
MKPLLRAGLVLLLAPAALWTGGAAWYALGGGAAGGIAAGIVLGGHGAFLLHPRWRPRTWIWTAAGFAAGLLWFATRVPSNDRDWRVEVSRAPTATIEGDRALVRDIRDFRYRSEEEPVPAWTDRTYDLRRLRGADLLLCRWDGNEAVAHTMLSFDFGEGEHLALSVEIRREKGEDWGGLPGIYRQFEVIWILADERDVVNLRTGYRGEDVHLYRLNLPAEEVRRYFEAVLRRCNDLAARPEFYDTITDNCSTSLARLTREVWPGRPPGPLSRLLNGRADEEAWRMGAFDTDLPFPELRRRSAISERARPLRDDPAFSLKVREGLPIRGR